MPSFSLPSWPFTLLGHKFATVQKNYHVFLSDDRHYYSVPYRFISKKVEIRYNGTWLEIYAGSSRIASHTRSRESGGYTTLTGHMPENHRFMQEWSMETFLSWAQSQDALIHRYLEEIFARRPHPEQAFRSCWGIQRLGKVYGTERLKGAYPRAIAFEQANRGSYDSLQFLRSEVIAILILRGNLQTAAGISCYFYVEIAG